MVTLQDIKLYLPNFPPEVLVEWLLPYAISEGWPPSSSVEAVPKGRWRYLLRRRSLSYWRSVSWQKVERRISIYELSPEYQEIMVQMTLGAVAGQRNLYSTSIPDLKQRFDKIVEYICEHATLPKPPVLLDEEEGISILDGNHRMAAYFYCRGVFNHKPSVSCQAKTREVQSYWVGKPNK